jgi:DNA polymerase-3 subunit epsilon
VSDEGWGLGPLVGFDLETTGLDRESDEPISYAFVEYHGGREVGHEVGYLLPSRPISEGATAVHGLTLDRLVELGALPLEVGLRRIAARLGALSAEGIPLVGCNLPYDLTLLDRALARTGTAPSLREAGWQGPALDVLVLDRSLDLDFDARPGRKLVAMCEHYWVRAPTHAARSDATAALEVLLVLAARFDRLAAASVEELQVRQTAWHAAWSSDYAVRKAPEGQLALFDLEEAWPYAERTRVRVR